MSDSSSSSGSSADEQKILDTLPHIAAGTPPPSLDSLEKNFPGSTLSLPPAHPAPSFQEFAMNASGGYSSAQLSPNEPILNTEIQQITEEDTKRTWEETGTLADEEDIKIHRIPVKGSSPSTTQASKKPQKKREKKKSSLKPVDLLNKKNSSSKLTSNNTPLAPFVMLQTASSGDGVPESILPSKKQTNTDQGDQAAPTPDLNPQLKPVQSTLSSTGQVVASTNFPPQTCPLPTQTTVSTASPPVPRPNKNPDSNRSFPDPMDTPQVEDPQNQDPSNRTPNVSHELVPVAAQCTSSSNHPPSANHDNHTSQFGNINITIIKSLNVRIKVIKIHQEVDGIKPNWQKYLNTWTSLTTLASFRVQSIENVEPHNPDFNFGRTSCSYASWIKNISSFAKDFLGPSTNEQWNCPDIINFPLLSTFANPDLPPHQFISTSTKTSHPESTLVRFLYRLQNPPSSVTLEWAKIVAALIELVADGLYQPPPPTIAEDEDEIVQGVQVLLHLDQMKNSISSFDATDEKTTDTGSEIIARSHSVDVLHEFQNLIIDVYMGYVILQTHALSDPPQSAAQKKSKKCATQSSSEKPGNSSSVAQIEKNSSNLAQLKEESSKQLQYIQGRHNFQPLVYFLLGGVRGLFITSKNYRTAPVSQCMSFIQAMALISQHSKTPRTPQEPIWKNLSAYIVQLFQPAFQTPRKIMPLSKAPNRTHLAEAIAMDFLNLWRDKQPSSPFLIPHSDQHLTET
ncbi:hypothetical protein PTTG_02980 [Puccinia triticina 1-1 BBBD Race 1]|uniref:Uncharacterized protein n=1 Tax=Puccinia triticina (isolate 1-1 / race 1 (BBBD)) TaxID=630390 RepID=A0A180GLF9_PUCT1|nr:hypothetical protein PTTG_02980 [Puccinia triticina 1-1 BBBD Race 1]